MATISSLPAPARDVGDVNDGELLDFFIRDKDEAAFAELVRRHGLMVLGVCQRVLDNPHDAEDCFQAAFLVLVRKATTIQPRQMVGNWLYGVAYRTALEAKKMAARRRNREKKKFNMPRPDSNMERWHELQPLLDQELNRLPDKYRFVLIACDLEGRTRKDVAQALEVPEGTVASRLARARALLAKRLVRHKVVIAPGALAAVLAENGAAFRLPDSLVAATTKAAAHLSAGKPLNGNVAELMNAVARSMLVTKLKIASLILLALALLGLGVGAFLPPAHAELIPDTQKTAPDPKKTKPELLRERVLQKIDLASRIIQTARLNPEAGRTLIDDLHVTVTARIIIDGKDGKLADLKSGVTVNLEVERSSHGKPKVVRIETIGAEFDGVVQAMDDNKLTIQSEKEPGGEIVEKIYDLARGAWIFVNGKKAKLTDLKPRMQVVLRVSADKPSVVGVVAAGPKVNGVLKAIDADRQKLSLRIKNTALTAESIAVAKDALVMIDGKTAKLSDLQVGMNVTVQMSAEMEQSYIVSITAGKR